MSRKDYIKAAAAVRRMVENPDVPDVVAIEVMGVLCEIFAADNERFDKERFVKACMGVEVAA